MYCCYRVKMLESVVENYGNVEDSKKSSIYNIVMLTISLLSVVFDIFIGSALVLQYYMSEKYNFAISTISFIFIPFVIIQVFSIKLYFLNNDMKAVQWILHLLLLGFICRYIITIKKCVRNFQSKTYFASSSFKENMDNLKNLYLFNCFMECVPQLILQLFIISNSNDFSCTRLSIYSSILSLAWALTTHTKFRKGNYCSLIVLMLWRIGMISARVSSLVLCAHICGPWIILFIELGTPFLGSHWLAMTLWITYQKSTANERKENGEFHSAIFGLIYCFCFFSLKFGQSKWQAITLNLLFLFENLIFLTVFLTRFSSEQPKLAVLSFFIVISGSLIGISSLLVYYLVYNTSGTDKCTSPIMQILFSKKVNGKNETFLECGSPEEQQHRDILSSNSVIIVEEDPGPDSNESGNLDISELRSENIYEEPKESETRHEGTHLNLPAAMKRRAICSSVDLEKFAENRTGDPEMEAEIVIADESPSEILSTRDYENICAVNIRREPWGIRSWRGYSDIETFRHDDSVVNEGRSDNLTASSEYSGKFEDKDSFISEEKSDIDTISGKLSLNFLPPSSSNGLEAIVEEEVTETDCKNDTETKCDGKSSLVETIDKICLYTPLRTRSPTIPNSPDDTEAGGIFGKNFRDSEKTVKFSVSRKLCLTAEKDVFSPLKDKFRPAHKLNIFKERYEINRYHIPSKSEDLMVQVNKTCPDKENLKSQNNQKTNKIIRNNQEINKIKHENSTISKAFSFKENGLFLKEIFTPSKSEKCNYRNSYMRR